MPLHDYIIFGGNGRPYLMSLFEEVKMPTLKWAILIEAYLHKCSLSLVVKNLMASTRHCEKELSY